MTTALEWGWGVSVTLRPLFTPGKTQYPLYRRVGGPQGRSGQLRKISPPTGVRSPDRPTRSQSLYLLSYPGPSSVQRDDLIQVKQFMKFLTEAVRNIARDERYTPDLIMLNCTLVWDILLVLFCLSLTMHHIRSTFSHSCLSRLYLYFLSRANFIYLVVCF